MHRLPGEADAWLQGLRVRELRVRHGSILLRHRLGRRLRRRVPEVVRRMRCIDLRRWQMHRRRGLQELPARLRPLPAHLRQRQLPATERDLQELPARLRPLPASLR